MGEATGWSNKTNIKIMFLARSLNVGGAERQLVNLAKRLHKQGWAVTVVVFYKNGIFERDLREAGVPVCILDKRGRWDNLSFIYRLIMCIHQERPTILHGYLVVPNILTVALKPFFPKIRMVWGVRSSNMDLQYYDWLYRFVHWVETRLSLFADLIIFNSRAGLEYSVKRGFKNKNMTVVPNGIDIYRFYPDPVARAEVRRELGISKEEKLIGIIGRLDPMKGHINFFKAAALLCRDRQNIRFVCVGDGPAEYRERLIGFCSDLGLDKQVIWTGSRDDTPRIYNALDIATSASVGEGFSNVIGEAMACGIPCVVTDVGDSAIIVGDAGVVVKPENSQELAYGWGCILDCSDQDYKLRSKKSRTRIQDKFSIEALCVKTIKELASL